MSRGPIAFRKGTAPEPQAREWFRIDNAFKDDESSTGETTVVYIYDEIGYGWFGGTAADDFVRMLSTIKTGKIRVHINSPGGDIFDGVAIYNALKHHAAEVEVVIDALAASAASFIAMAGDNIIMTPAATMMIHDGSAGLYGFAADHREVADLLDKLSDTVAGIYNARAGGTRQSWRDLMMATTWYNAEEAVAAGLADEIEGDTKAEDTEAAKNTWGKSIYNVASASPSPHALRERILNTIKETNVSQSAPEPEAPVTPPTPQPAPPAPAPAEPETEPVTPEAPAAAPAAPEAPAPVEPEPVQPALPENVFRPTNVAGNVAFQVAGRVVSDPQAIQNHIASLEEFQNQTFSIARNTFVDDLVRDKKVMGTEANITALKAYAASLTNEGFTAWKATYENAPQIGLIAGTHADNQAGASSTPGSPRRAADPTPAVELEVARETVKSLMISGVKGAQLEATPSFKKLLAADPTFKPENL